MHVSLSTSDAAAAAALSSVVSLFIMHVHSSREQKKKAAFAKMLLKISVSNVSLVESPTTRGTNY